MGHLLQFKLPRAQVEGTFLALRGTNGDDLRRELASLLCPFLDNENVCEIACCAALNIGEHQFPKMKDERYQLLQLLDIVSRAKLRNRYVRQF